VILLLDAHVVLWALADPESLAPEARAAIAEPGNEVLVSVGSVWELEIKQAAGKLRLGADLLADMDRARFGVLSITAIDAVAAARLPLHHRDPFDRMLIAQAARLDAAVVTRDAAFTAYEVEVLPA
jgi:PIN domain nuclease of toxin-antitoxin system